jgi:hypothetical protein
MKSHVVVISRKWAAPEISVTVTNKEIGMEMSLEQFIESVVSEVGNPALLLTRSALTAKVSQAVDKVVAEMKDATKHAV